MTDIIDPFTGAAMPIRTSRKPAAYIMIDVESAVIDRTAHKRYVDMERPSEADLAGRTMNRRKLGPILEPRWPFQTIVTASAMVLNVHGEGNVEVGKFETWSAPEMSEQQVLQGLFDLVSRSRLPTTFSRDRVTSSRMRTRTRKRTSRRFNHRTTAWSRRTFRSASWPSSL